MLKSNSRVDGRARFDVNVLKGWVYDLALLPHLGFLRFSEDLQVSAAFLSLFSCGFERNSFPTVSSSRVLVVSTFQ